MRTARSSTVTRRGVSMTESPLDKDSLGQRPSLQTQTTPDTDHPLDRDHPLEREPPPDRMTDACENITLLQTSFERQ